MDETDVVLATEKWMPGQSKDALEHFLVTNPQMRGAHWADVLSILLGTDAHCDLTEAIYDDLKIIVPIDTVPFIVPVFLTLLYANKGHVPYATWVAYWHGRVTGMLELEGGTER